MSDATFFVEAPPEGGTTKRGLVLQTLRQQRVALGAALFLAACVVMAAPGYPTDTVTGGIIEGLDDDGQRPDALIFHAGTARDERGRWVTDGGRVLGVTAVRSTATEARDAAYAAAAQIRWDGAYYRKDIGATA